MYLMLLCPIQLFTAKGNSQWFTGTFGAQMSSGHPHFHSTHNTPLPTLSSQGPNHILCCYLFVSIVIYVILYFLLEEKQVLFWNGEG